MIHCFSQNGYNICLDVNSGGVHLLDELTYKVICTIDEEKINMTKTPTEGLFDNIKLVQYTRKQILESYNELFELFSEGLLYSDDKYLSFVDKITASPIKSMCLNVAHDCNLRCEYCFASTGDFGEGRKLLTFETGKKAIDFLIDNSAKRHNLELDFFGGEPLMNFKVVKKIVEYAREQEKLHDKNFRFTLTTNGMLLNDEISEYLNKEMTNVVLSIDGRKEVNDRVRKKVNGSGSYDQIIKNFKTLVDGRGEKEYYVRGTFTKYNLDFSEDVFHLYNQGFKQISVEPVVSQSDKPYAITEDEIPQICDEYDKLAKMIVKNRKDGEFFNFFHFMIDLDGGPCAIKRLKGCGCGNEYVAVTPDGDIYPCHQFVGQKEWKMGNLDEETFDTKKKNYFCKTNIYFKDECQNCWAKFYCSGGCNANNYQYAGDVMRPHKISCQLLKKRTECALMIKAALA